ncbi:MAG: hypothetical protein JNK08_06095 [Sediminibacterium sp.]|nr:hypothetical protein [Sediminibacterium sp.]
MKTRSMLLSCCFLLFLGTSWHPKVEQASSNKEKVTVSSYGNYDYDRGYNQGYSLGNTNNSTLFGTRYADALERDLVDYAEGMLDGYNEGKMGGSSAPGGGGGNPTDGNGCKIVMGDQDLVDYLNNLGFGCYVNYE